MNGCRELSREVLDFSIIVPLIISMKDHIQIKKKKQSFDDKL